ncbi:hypothetical protein [Vibrio tapetis]|uniref:Uncharacterized protein n=1 Tax=Vibrio tapetis subsp. tapetis TaxID=1671868 RepID=A0A2N8ZJ92_9VIBR|nr:hypothetical protein [Vibrio tapetis]SON51978.1 conserved membrane protein of unknown function [Vibrio tapetis subsp. tapetis]
MKDDFFENHELSIWIFFVGIAVIISMMIGGGVTIPLLLFTLEQLIGEFTPKMYGIHFVLLVITMTLFTVVPSLFIIRGKKALVKVNKMTIFIQVVIYCFALVIYEHEYKYFFLSFVSFPLLALWLMSTPKYRAFVAYHEALHKDPIGFRQKLLDRAIG